MPAVRIFKGSWLKRLEMNRMYILKLIFFILLPFIFSLFSCTIRKDSSSNTPSPKPHLESDLEITEKTTANDAFLLGQKYYEGEGLRQDYSLALKWYTTAAKQGHPKAQTQLGRMYGLGEGVKKDYKNAIKWTRKAAEQGHSEAQKNMGLCYKKGWGVKKDDAVAFSWFKKAAKQNNIQAICNLAIMYEEGTAVPQNYKKAFEHYKKAAALGGLDEYPFTGFLIAEMYFEGKGVIEDYDKAFAWYKKAAERGIPEAQFKLAHMYKQGDGCSQNLEAYIKWLKIVAKEKDTDSETSYPKQAALELGEIYEKGEIVPQNSQEAIKYYQKAAELGASNAYFKIATIYEEGRGIAPNGTESYKWYIKAAMEDSDAYAAFNIGLKEYFGEGVPKDQKAALIWFEGAALGGHVLAQTLLGNMYASGHGVAKDPKKLLNGIKKRRNKVAQSLKLNSP
jgi:TPR repeat protein